MKFLLPDYVKNTVSVIQNAGFEAFCVGGCVRDMILGRKPNDFDITTSASPEEIIKLFPRTVATGLKHGTVTVLQDKMPLEVTTYRTDGKYTDSRHPESVTFVKSLKEDLSRRDFTVNAIAYSDSDGITDYYGGCNDIKNKVLKTVGNPENRFSEDALRILRLFRFSSQLNFTVEENTLNAAIKLKDSVSLVSRERTFAELKKLIMSDYPENAEYYINCGGLDFLGISGIKSIKTLKTVKKDFNLRFYVFCTLANVSPEVLCINLKTDNNLKKYVADMEKIKNMPLLTKADIKKALYITSPYCVNTSLLLRNLSLDIFNEVITQNEPYMLSQLAVTGNDLAKLGINGKQTGGVLRELLFFTFESPENNKKEILIKKAKSIVTK